MTAPLRQPVSLHAALSKIFGVQLADGAAAHDWLRAGGWRQFDQWVKTHRGDPKAEEAQPETEETPNHD